MPAYGARAGRAPLSQQDTGPRLVASIRRTVETGTSLGFSALRCRAIRERLRTGRIALPLPQEVIAEVGYAEISQTEVRAAVPLIGYVERFSTRPGERVAVGVSSPLDRLYLAGLVRSTHADANPAVPTSSSKTCCRGCQRRSSNTLGQ